MHVSLSKLINRVFSMLFCSLLLFCPSVMAQTLPTHKQPTDVKIAPIDFSKLKYCNWNGTFETQHGNLFLNHGGNIVTGRYASRGYIAGNVDNDCNLKARFSNHEMNRHGELEFKLAPDATFTGTWHWSGVAAKAAWTGKRINASKPTLSLPSCDWTGTFKSTHGELKFLQDGLEAAADYAGRGVVGGTISRPCMLTGKFHNSLAKRGGNIKFHMIGDVFAGEWSWAGDKHKQNWTGAKSSANGWTPVSQRAGIVETGNPIGLMNMVSKNIGPTNVPLETVEQPPTCTSGICKTTQPLAAKRMKIWDHTRRINVCWATRGYAKEKQWVRAKINKTWEKESRVRFTGWNDCGYSYAGVLISDPEGFGIRIAEENPRSKLGTDALRLKRAMTLNFTFKKWSESCSEAEDKRKRCIEYVAVHEFGHVLGFKHEQERADNPPSCKEKQEGRSMEHDFPITPYDINSVMNYCNPKWNNNGQLSPMDKEGLRTVYGWPKSASYNVSGVGHSGDGAGLAIGQIDSNPRPDMIMMAYDDPDGQNQFRYKVGFNLNEAGKAERWSSAIKIDGLGHEGEGAGIAIGQIGGNSRPDIVLMAYDAPSGPNNFKYKIGFDLDQNGVAARWSGSTQVPGVGHSGDGAGAYLTNLNGKDGLDLVLMAYDDPDGPNKFIYKVGWDLSDKGVAKSWGPNMPISGLGHAGEGASVIYNDIHNSGGRALTLVSYDGSEGSNYYQYQTFFEHTPYVAAPGFKRQISGQGKSGEGAGADMVDLDGNDLIDLILMSYDAPDGPNEFRYKVFFDMAWAESNAHNP